jgi:site-specific DNA-methyltransferase (adenine-specific)
MVSIEKVSSTAYDLKWNDSVIYLGNALDVLKRIPSESFQSVITSPPYWGVRNYGIDGQIGLETTIDQYLNKLLLVFAEVKRVLKNDGTLWLNIGDIYTSGNRGYRASDKRYSARFLPEGRPDNPMGLKNKDLIGLPWRLAFVLQNDGWFLRSDIIWHKPNAMPESVKDRPIKSHEYIFLFSKNEKYYYDYTNVMEPAKTKEVRGLRSVWSLNTVPFPGSHSATFPVALVEPCVRASSKSGDFILDPFFGTGTVGLACQELGRKFVGIELNSNFTQIALERLQLSNDKILHIPGVDENKEKVI